jgi:hypothetical protein
MPIKPGTRLCIDRVIPLHLKARAAELAMKEAGINQPKLSALTPKARGRTPALMPGASGHPAKIAFFTGKKWKKGRTLGIQFLDGSATQKQKAQHFAKEWLQFANLKFDFSAGAASDVRISFQADPGSWSAIGTDALVTEYFKKEEPTMNFGWLQDDTEDQEWRRVVVHEFGHAIGAIHEHQNPKGGIQWNLAAVYAYFSGPPNNWSKEDIDFNVVQKYSMSQLNATSFDPKSIMLYAFPAELIKGGKATSENTDLSKGDKTFVAKMYPKK